MVGFQQDAVERAFALIVSDDRRKLSPEDDEVAKRFWRQSFRQVTEKDLLQAVTQWLEENPRGRPNVGKIREILKRNLPSLQREEAQADDADRKALRWAVSVLEALHRGGEWASRMNHPHYKHTVEYAEKELRYQRFQHWHDAKAHLEPGWAPSTVTEVYL